MNHSFPRIEIMTSSKHRGFSLLEMLIVISISLILAGVTSMVWGPVMNQQHVTSAYNATLTTLRRARDQASADMRVYVVSFATPGRSRSYRTPPQGRCWSKPCCRPM